MKKEKEKQNWEKEFDEIFGGKLFWSTPKGLIPQGITPKFVRYAKGEPVEVIKEFIRQLLEKQKEEILEKIQLKAVKRNVSFESFIDDYYMGYNQAVEDLEQLKEKLKTQL